MANETTKVAPATKVKAKKKSRLRKANKGYENTHSYFSIISVFMLHLFYCSYELV